MSDFLLELLSEEIPARMQEGAAQQLHEAMARLLAESGLVAGELRTFVTPRRLALLAQGLPAQSQAVADERRGPRADAPAKAIEGFLRSTGLSRDQLEERDTGKGVFLFASLTRAGQPTAELLAARLPGLIAAFHWPKSQRWGAASIRTDSPRWVRPLRGIVALLDDALVPFEALGLRSGRETLGHRFLCGPQPIALASAASYEETLRLAHVLVDAGERRRRIADGADRAARAAGLVLRPDPALVGENAGLTEWPVPLCGRFDPAFLAVPPEIIRLTMATNQKYFAVEDGEGRLAPAFVCVANLDAPDGGRAIVHGNERVLSARLSDARFFWEQDRKTPLAAFAGKLAGVVFQETLGTMADKVERVARLARWLAETHFPAIDPALAEHGARLLKADLASGTVGEFPELQGVIGGYLAAAEGEPAAVAAAIGQQYRPCPEGGLAVLLALADRVDTLSSFFSAGIRPTGSKDPFALRRAALGVVDMLVTHRLRIPLGAFLQQAGASDARQLIDFLADRLKVQQREAGIPHDLVDAVFALGDEDDLVRLLMRVEALKNFLASADGRNLLAGYRRAANILRAEERKDGREYRLQPGAWSGLALASGEERLARLFVGDGSGLFAGDGSGRGLLPADIDSLLAAEDYAGAMQRLSVLREPVDCFFEDVTVNDADPAVRARRLGLLSALRDTMHKVADFSRIEG